MPPTFGNVAAALAAAAAAPLEDGIRTVVAPGPQHAHDCRMVAVNGQVLGWVNLDQRLMAATGGASALQAEYQVTFVADCVPATDTGAPPPAQAITDWSTAMLDDWEKAWRAVATACDAGLPTGDPPARLVAPEGIDLVGSRPFGPQGGAAGWRGTVRVLLAP